MSFFKIFVIILLFNTFFNDLHLKMDCDVLIVDKNTMKAYYF